jgi:hypothetical protein
MIRVAIGIVIGSSIMVAAQSQSTVTIVDALGIFRQLVVKTNPDGSIQVKCAE